MTTVKCNVTLKMHRLTDANQILGLQMIKCKSSELYKTECFCELCVWSHVNPLESKGEKAASFHSVSREYEIWLVRHDINLKNDIVWCAALCKAI